MTHQIKKNLGVTRHGEDTEFRVWAPFATNVALAGTVTRDQSSINLQQEIDGYWSIRLKGVLPGQNYVYLLTTANGEVVTRNDPRARQLTASDDGASVIVDSGFDWEDDSFSIPATAQQIFYELHVGTFNRRDAATIGTFEDALEKIDHLARLGITVIELMPITSMAHGYGWGYAPNHIFSVENAYGGRHGLMTFVRECHKKGIAVILDVVFNHFSNETDLWKFDGWSENDRGGIYFYNDARGDTPWGGRPDYGRPEVRQFILDSVTMWLTEYHLDGLRVDSTIYMRNTEGIDNDPAHDIDTAWLLLQDITELAHRIKPNAIMIAEDCANNSYLTRSRGEGGCDFDAQWELGFPHALRAGLGLQEEPSLVSIRSSLERRYNDSCFERVIFSDSHDTAANGSVRLNQAASLGHAADRAARQRSLLATAITLTAPGIPMLLQGQEFLQDGSFNDWQELQWDRADEHRGMVQAYHDLIQLRLNHYRNTSGLLGNNISVFHQDEAGKVLAYRRWGSGTNDDVIVIANFANHKYADYQVKLPLTGAWRVRFNSTWRGYCQDFPQTDVYLLETDASGAIHLELSPYMALILSRDTDELAGN